MVVLYCLAEVIHWNWLMFLALENLHFSNKKLNNIDLLVQGASQAHHPYFPFPHHYANIWTDFKVTMLYRYFHFASQYGGKIFSGTAKDDSCTIISHRIVINIFIIVSFCVFFQDKSKGSSYWYNVMAFVNPYMLRIINCCKYSWLTDVPLPKVLKLGFLASPKH